MATNPKPFLKSLIGERVIVRLKWDACEYSGILKSTDSYMNFQLSEAKEFQNGKLQGEIGDAMIRCNNVMWISKEQKNNSEQQ